MAKEWKAALEPYDLNDSLCSLICMATAHGAVEAMAEQWKFRNVAYANLLKSRSFPVLSAQSANTDRSQVQVGSRATRGLASSTCTLLMSIQQVQLTHLTMACLMKHLLPPFDALSVEIKL